MKKYLTTICFYLFMVIAFPLWYIILLPLSLIFDFFGIDPRKRLFGYITRRIAGLAILFNPFWDIETIYIARDKIPNEMQKIVCVCNHQSNLDPFALAWSLPFETKWVAKAELFSLPFAGWTLSIIGDIPLVFKSKELHDMRTEKESVKACMSKCKEYLLNDTGVTLFPEGRRSVDGELLEFKPGAFILAVETGSDILPCALTGTGKMWPVLKDPWMHPGKCTVVIGTPISTKGYTNTKESISELMAKVKSEIENLKKIGDGVKKIQ